MNKNSEDLTVQEVYDSMNIIQRELLYKYAGQAIEGNTISVSQADRFVYNSLNDNQKKVFLYMIHVANEERKNTTK